MRKAISIICLTFSVLFSNLVFGNEFRPRCPESGCVAANPECPKRGCFDSRYLRDSWINSPTCEGSPWAGDLDVNTWDNCVGKITSADESRRVYFGRWKNGQLHGMGYYSSETPTFEYYGEWENGRPNGNGRSHWYDGKEFSGRFVDGKRHGRGYIINKDGQIVDSLWRWGKYVRRDSTKDDDLCVQALDVDKVNWSNFYHAQAHVAQAKRRHLTVSKCRSLLGLGPLPTRTAKPKPPKVVKPAPSYANLSDPRLCKKALDSSRKSWDRSRKYKPYSNAAKRRGLTIKYCRLVLGISKPKPPVRVAKPKPPKIYQAGSGTGFVITKAGHLLTNHHVVDKCTLVELQLPGRKVRATVLAIDPVNDLALLKANFKPKGILKMSTGSPFIMQRVFVVGYPFGKAIGTSVKVSSGIVSSLADVRNNSSRIQTDAAMNAGNSGGPIINENGDVVAVSVATLSAKYIQKRFGKTPQGINYGIKASVASNFAETNGVRVTKGSNRRISDRARGKLAENATIYIGCGMTKAQIKAAKQTKTMFPNVMSIINK